MTCWKTCLRVLKCIFIAQVLFSLFHIVEDMSISKTCLKYGTKTRFLQWSLHFQTLHLSKSLCIKIPENSENYYHGIWHFRKRKTCHPKCYRYHCWWHWKPEVSPCIIWSLHTLFDNMLTHANRMVQAMQNFVLFDKKWLAIFDKKLTSFWKMFLWLKQLFDAELFLLI